jgi:hypothetical protein
MVLSPLVLAGIAAATVVLIIIAYFVFKEKKEVECVDPECDTGGTGTIPSPIVNSGSTDTIGDSGSLPLIPDTDGP